MTVFVVNEKRNLKTLTMSSLMLNCGRSKSKRSGRNLSKIRTTLDQRRRCNPWLQSSVNNRGITRAKYQREEDAALLRGRVTPVNNFKNLSAPAERPYLL